MARSLADKMRTAAEWLDHYEAGDDPDTEQDMMEMFIWLKNEADRRDKEATIAAIAKEHHVSPKVVVREAIRLKMLGDPI